MPHGGTTLKLKSDAIARHRATVSRERHRTDCPVSLEKKRRRRRTTKWKRRNSSWTFWPCSTSSDSPSEGRISNGVPGLLLNARIGVAYTCSFQWQLVLYTYSSLYIRKLVCLRTFSHHPTVPLFPMMYKRRMYRLKASFTVTVLETRTDQNSFFIGRALSRMLDYPFSGTP